jgi:4-coumarate--CoA ligase
VIGIDNKEEHTEVPRAYIVPEAGVEPDAKFAKEISDWIAGKVANHKKLRGGVYFIKEVPKSVSGKILRRVLKEQALKEDALTKAKL